MKYIKKTNRKNKTKQIVNWPDTFFTIKQLNESNKEIIEISLRKKVQDAVDEKFLDKIGTIHNETGRPTLVFALKPITQELLKSAEDSGVLLNDCYAKTNVSVVDIKTQNSEKTDNVFKTDKKTNQSVNV